MRCLWMGIIRAGLRNPLHGAGGHKARVLRSRLDASLPKRVGIR
jgi:hypothetical protein